MSDKEMFEKLDFENTLKNESLLLYERIIECKNNFYSEVITFHYSDKTLSYINIDYITLPLLQAINKQIEELGWNNES